MIAIQLFLFLLFVGGGFVCFYILPAPLNILAVIVYSLFALIMITAVWLERHDGRDREERKRDRFEREQAYEDALPSRYPYISGYTYPDNLPIIKRGENYFVVSVIEAKGLPEHPHLYMDQYKGDAYRSTNQMKEESRY